MVIAVTALVAVNVLGTNSLAATGARDCNNNSIIYCGALTQSELLSKYDANASKDLTQVYDHYGISRSDLAGTTSQVVMGRAFRDGHVEVNGQTVATNAYSVGRFNIGNSRPVNIAGKTFYERASSDVFLSDIDAFVLMRNGQFYRAVLTSCSNPLTATPTPPKPVYTCNALTANKISRNDYSFDTTANATNGATVVSYEYDFGDGKTMSSTSSQLHHIYDKAGQYTVKVSVTVQVNGSTQLVSSQNCQTVVTVAEVPPAPVYSCTSLEATVISLQDRSYQYDLTYVATNGATLASVDYNFGDNQFVTLNGSVTQSTAHTYQSAGSFKTTATLHFMVVDGSTVMPKSVTCEVAISTSPDVCLLNPALPKGDVRCQPCAVPGKENLPKDSTQCVTPVVPQQPQTPAELPHTGISDILGSGLGIGSLTAATYYWRGSRRSLLNKIANL
jgi:PKD repeat protein